MVKTLSNSVSLPHLNEAKSQHLDGLKFTERLFKTCQPLLKNILRHPQRDKGVSKKSIFIGPELYQRLFTEICNITNRLCFLFCT